MKGEREPRIGSGASAGAAGKPPPPTTTFCNFEESREAVAALAASFSFVDKIAVGFSSVDKIAVGFSSVDKMKVGMGVVTSTAGGPLSTDFDISVEALASFSRALRVLERVTRGVQGYVRASTRRERDDTLLNEGKPPGDG